MPPKRLASSSIARPVKFAKTSTTVAPIRCIAPNKFKPEEQILDDMTLYPHEPRGAFTPSHQGSGNNNTNTGRGPQHTGTGNITQNNVTGSAYIGHNQITNNYDAKENERNCLKHLRTTDPRMDKKRIEGSKGGLLKDSYRWILEHTDYHKWRHSKDSQILWIKGDPGKGKTMLLCGIIDEMSVSAVPEIKGSGALLSFFFCQATDSRINNAKAVLRGLIYLLVDEKQSLLWHVREKYDDAGQALFEDANAWFALCEILESILQDPTLGTTYLMIDALDECTEDLPKLLDLIIHTSAIAPAIKWIISSRNWPIIEESLRGNKQNITLCLELNHESVSDAVSIYIKHKTDQLAFKKQYDHRTREAVLQHLVLNAKDTFLWVALVCQNLESVTRRKVLLKLKEFPPGLDPLYQHMVKQINDSEDAELCKQILAITLTVYKPITLAEISFLFEKPVDMPDDLESLEEVIALCGSLLTLRRSTIYFVHQSAKDFLLKRVSDDIFPSGVNHVHYNLFCRSLQVMSKTLGRDLYSLRHPGVIIDQVKQPNPDPLAAARYSCVHWGDHLIASDVKENHITDLKDGGFLCSFLSTYYLYWLEALSLIRRMTDGIAMIIRIESWLSKANDSPELHVIIQDEKRFAIYNRSLIEKAPLQLYCSALLFAPQTSIVRTTFANSIPNWIKSKPITQHQWSGSLQTLEGHHDAVNSVAFSPDGKSVVSGSDDSTVRLWDAATGAPMQTLEGHSGCVISVAFSPNGKSVVSGSWDRMVRLWDVATGAPMQTLEGHSGYVTSVAFSPDGKSIVSGSWDRAARLWDATTGAPIQTLEGHCGYVTTVAFSPDGKSVVSGSWDRMVRLWDAVAGTPLQTLEGHSGYVTSVAFSPDGKSVVSGSDDTTVRLWDAATGATLQTLQGHSGYVKSVAFSPDGKSVVSGSYDNTLRLWDTATGAPLKVLEGHSREVSSVAFSPDGKSVVSGSEGTTVRLWDAATGGSLHTLEGHSDYVTSISFSKDGKSVVSGSYDSTLRLWDTATGAPLKVLEGHSCEVSSVAFSPDGKLVVSGSDDTTVRLWDAATGATLQTLQGHSRYVSSVAFSPDGKSVVSGSYDNTLRLWNTATGASLKVLGGHFREVSSVAFSPDGKTIVSGSYDSTVRLWDAVTGAMLQMLEGHSRYVTSVAFSTDGKSVVSGFHDNTVQLWDVATGATLQMLEEHPGAVNLIASRRHDPEVQTTTLIVQEEWIVLKGKKTLWLPPEYRPSRVASHNSVVCLGLSSGCVIMIGFGYDML